MSLKKIQDILEIEDSDIKKIANQFTPYLYLDGHRSSGVGNNDTEKYKAGFTFFLRFGQIMQDFGFKELVTMVHTSRNCKVSGRFDSIKTAILESFEKPNTFIKESAYKLYGDFEAYNNNADKNFYNFVKDIEKSDSKVSSFTNHILINYSEDWALNNPNKISMIPDISSVIRFTKGYISGGWIPAKMTETTFIYSQIPSVSDFWSDDALTALLFIAIKNWSVMTQYIGKKQYNTSEKETIHNERDINLNFCKYNLDIDSIVPNRIIAFGIYGPILYEI